MFTGIVEQLGSVVARHFSQNHGQKHCHLHLRTSYTDLTLGESLSVNGVCLTVAEKISAEESRFYLSHETLALSNLGEAEQVNLERALKVGDRLSGHWVQGHVDGLGKVSQLRDTGETHELTLKIPAPLLPYMSPKGSLTVNGVSLTINQIRGDEVSLALIPHTWKHTNLQFLKIGSKVNLEADILAKTLESLIRHRPLSEQLCQNCNVPLIS